MKEREFFSVLVEKTRVAFNQSDINKNFPDKDWYYSVCATPIRKNKPIFMGLNWGVSKPNENFKGHEPQVDYPSGDIGSWRTKTLIDKYLVNYFGYRSDQVNYSNLCFFRSEKEDQLTQSDWRDSIALFKEYVEYINPPYLIMMGVPKHLNENEIKEIKTQGYRPKNKPKTYYLRTATLFEKFPLASVPHPTAPVYSEARKALWDMLIKTEPFNSWSKV